MSKCFYNKISGSGVVDFIMHIMQCICITKNTTKKIVLECHNHRVGYYESKGFDKIGEAGEIFDSYQIPDEVTKHIEVKLCDNVMLKTGTWKRTHFLFLQ